MHILLTATNLKCAVIGGACVPVCAERESPCPRNASLSDF